MLVFSWGLWTGRQKSSSWSRSFRERMAFQMKHWPFPSNPRGGCILLRQGGWLQVRTTLCPYLLSYQDGMHHFEFFLSSGKQTLLSKMYLYDMHWEVTQKLLKCDDPTAAMTGECRSHPQKQKHPRNCLQQSVQSGPQKPQAINRN